MKLPVDMAPPTPPYQRERKEIKDGSTTNPEPRRSNGGKGRRTRSKNKAGDDV